MKSKSTLPKEKKSSSIKGQGLLLTGVDHFEEKKSKKSQKTNEKVIGFFI